jgi:hypothetical protein
MAGGPEGLEIVIPANRNLALAIFLGMWLAGWLMGVWNAIGQVRRDLGSDPVLLIWLITWTAAGIVVAYLWLWTLVGNERVIMGTSMLRVKRDVLGLGWTRVYALTKIRNLRVAAPSRRLGSPNLALGLAGFMGGMIAFEYEGRTIRFGASLDEADAQTVVDRMRQRYGFPEAPAGGRTVF